MRRILGRLNANRGQVLIIFVLMFSVISILGILVVDVGIWYSERRADQTDADLPALAGARQCMLQMVTGDFNSYDPLPVVDRVWKDNVPGNPGGKGFSYTATGCFDPTSGGACDADSPFCCVDVVAKHKTAQLFSNLPIAGHIFDDISQNMDAKARACAGAAQSYADTLPSNPIGDCFQAPGQPDFDHLCWISGGAHDNDCDIPGNRCWLQLSGTGPACSPPETHDLSIDEIYATQGLGAECSIDPNPPTCGAVAGTSGWSDCVALDTGNPHLQDDVYNRIKGAPCDTNGNGVDDLSEVLDPVTGDPTICSPSAPEGQRISPRLITVPVIDKPGEGTCSSGEPCPINAFATFYMAGCVDDQHDPIDDILAGTTPLSTPQIKCTEKISPGQDAILGKWVKLIVAGSGVGPANGSTTTFGLALCDWETGGNCAGIGGGTPGPTAVPTDTPAPTPTACHGSHCPTDTPRPPTATPVPTHTPVPPPTATPCPPGCAKPNGGCYNNCP